VRVGARATTLTLFFPLATEAIAEVVLSLSHSHFKSKF
jgi:hypothetical protein